MVTAQINHCNSPIDVTFRVRNIDPNGNIEIQKSENESAEFSANPRAQQFFRGLQAKKQTKYQKTTATKPPFKPNIDWQYTFVTTNQPESREIPGFHTSDYDGTYRGFFIKVETLYSMYP